MNLPITLNKIEVPSAEIFYNDESIGILNLFELNDLRIQIKFNKLEGFSVLHNHGHKEPIDTDGKISNWPEQFNLLTDQLFELI